MSDHTTRVTYDSQQTAVFLQEQGEDLAEGEERTLSKDSIHPGKSIEFPISYGGEWRHYGAFSLLDGQKTIRIRRRTERELLLDSLKDLKTGTWETLPTDTLRALNALLWENQAPVTYALALTSMSVGQSLTLIPSFRYDEKRGCFVAPLQRDGRARTLYVRKERMQRALTEMLSQPTPQLEALFNPYLWEPDGTEDILLTSSVPSSLAT